MSAERDLAALGLAGLGAWLLLRQARSVGSSIPIASVSTSESFDLSPYGGATSYPEPIKRFATAIARQEGFYVTGSVPQLANNPGDLKVPGLATLPGTSITKFQTAAAGFDALYRQLYLILTNRSTYYDMGMTIEDMSRIWTATEQGAWARNVSAFLGVSPATPLYQVLA